MSIVVRAETSARMSDAELIEAIENKLGGKELSQNFSKLIIETHVLLKNTQDKVESIYPKALEESFSKEEAKTIVATLLGCSVRTVERYIPTETKSAKMVEGVTKALKDKHREPTEGTLNEEGKYGKPSELREQGVEVDTITDTKEHEPSETAEQTLKRISKPFKSDIDITIQGRTFTIKATANPLTREITAEYSEKQIVKILKGNKE